eukprot:TRINITY_DN4564_c0_g1_i1.p2 TRINITY_DN4564_c0_g1~~TRINITY_DN4564_c0_g1_i1.p2  ORF type:complete len:164 (+),score=24.88 TRINITY_DN4564_c0_g1_i1:97-588(+)
MALRKCYMNLASSYGVASPYGRQSLFAVAERLYCTAFSSDCKYMKSHEWASSTDGENATVGISDFAQNALGEVVYVETPQVGSEVKKGEQFGVVESVKAASDIYSPVSGEVIAVNEALTDDPKLINEKPFTDGWMIKVKMSDKSEYDSLLGVGDYKAVCEQDH